MKTLRKATNLLGLAVLMTLGGIQLCSADPAAEVRAIHAVDAVWVKACNRGDVDTMVGLYDEHAVLLPPGAPAAKGRAAIRAFFTKMVTTAGMEGLVFLLDTRSSGGGAYGAFGWSSGSYVLKDKTDRVVDTGKYLSVSSKKHGKWLYVRDTWNSDGPPAPTEPAAGAKK